MNTQSTHPDENRLSNFMEGTCKIKSKVPYRLPHGNFKMKKRFKSQNLFTKQTKKA